MATIFPTTPHYEGGTTAAGANGCGDLFGWLFGIFAVPTPAYEVADPPPGGSGGATLGTTGRDETGAAARACDAPVPHTILAPTGPVTIVLGADVAFAQQ